MRAVRLAVCLLVVACNQPEDATSDAQFGQESESLTGQNGAISVTTANTVLNQYGVLAANIAAGASSLTITSAADFPASGAFTTALAANDLLLLYQPSGATIDSTDTATFGAITALNGAGNYEFIHVASVAGTTITLETSCGGTKNAYTTAGLTEVIRVPQASTVAVSGTGSIAAANWDGARGGVVAVQAQSTMTIGGNGVLATGAGFRGGVIDNVTTGPPGTVTIRSATAGTGGEKGESIAGYEASYDANSNGRYGRGAPANGGGGGDAHNAAGGGGANGNNGVTWTGFGNMDATVTGGAAAWKLDPDYISTGTYTTSSGGGRGGYTYGASNQDPTTVGPGNTAWTGDNRRSVGGFGGRPLTNDPTARLFLGGGGGAGDENNAVGGNGGRGGGLVILLADSVSGTATVTSNGSVGTTAANDGAGGGGAGGTVVIAARVLGGVTVHADGATGGNQTNQGAESEGPGGGGGGGFIALAGGTVTTTNVGALGGTSASTAVAKFPTNGATKGANGDAVATATGLPVCLPDDLSITNSDGKTSATPGQTDTYTIVVTNNGADIMNGAHVTDTFPAALTGMTWTCTASAGSSCATANGNGSIATTGTLLPGGTLTYVATGTISPTATGTLTTTASVSPPTGITDPTTGNNSAADSDSLTPSANVGVTITANPTPNVAPNTNEVYTVTVTNAGPSDAGATTVVDTLPAGAVFVSATGTGWTCTQTGNKVTCTSTGLPVGTAPVITITTKSPPYGGTASDSVTATGTATDPNTTNNSATTSTTVTGNADMTLGMTGPMTATAGSTLTYVLTATNNGTGVAGNVTVTDTLPAGATFVSATGTGWMCTVAGQVVTCTAPSEGLGAAPAITIQATAPLTGPITNAATVASTTPDPNTANNAASVTTAITASADLEVEITASPDPVVAGAPITYTVDVTNHGPSASSTVVVSDTLPPGAVFVSATGTGWTCTQAGQVVTCTAATLPTGAAPAITIVANAPASGGTVNDVVTVGAATSDPVITNNTASVVSHVTTSADLGVVVTESPADPDAGGTLTYTVSVTNNGPSDASTATVTDTLPPGTTFVSATGSGWTCTQTGQLVTCTAATLPSGAAPDITVIATAPAMGGTITDTVTVGATTADPTMTNNSASVTTDVGAKADLGITITSTSPVTIGGTLGYDVNVTNSGPSTANMLVVTVTLPDGTTYVSGTGDGWTCSAQGQVVTCTKDSLDSGGNSDITIVTTVNGPAGTLTTSANVTASTTDPTPANNASSSTTVVSPDAIGVRGGGLNSGGCDATGGGSGIAVALLIGLVLLRKKKRVVVALLFTATPAFAQLAGTTQSFPVERMRTTLDRNGLLAVEWADGLQPWQWDIGTWLGYANDPLTFYNERTGDRVGSLVHNRLGGGLFGAVGITSWFELGLDLPLVYAQSNQISSESIGSPASPRFGDLRFVPKLTLKSGEGDHLGIALAVAFSLPSGGSSGYAGDDGATFVPELIISHAFGAWRFAGNLGYVARSEKIVANLDVDDEIDLKLGAGYRFSDTLEVDLNGLLGTPAAHPYSHINSDPSEVDVGAQLGVHRDVTINVGGGIGIGAGFGSPDFRLFAALRYSHRPAPAPVVAVVEPPKPEPVKKADPDTDGDGWPDSVDKCPNEPEDKDGFEDADGCPDPDNDKDGVLDVNDKCPNVPGPADNAGCPDPDRDGDGIPDRVDNCPDEPGTVENHGCAAKQLVNINNGKIELVDAVYFRTDKDIIEKRSFTILDNVATVLAAHPEITSVQVEGHTDNRGGTAHNLDLSQRRASAVVKYLVGKGIDRSRLEPIGYGETKPIETNTTDKGRATNRRVEFVIKGSDVGVKPTGPDGETIGK